MSPKFVLYAVVLLALIVGQSLGQMPSMGPQMGPQTGPQMPAGPLTNATNILQELMNQANQMMQQNNQMGGSNSGSSGTSNPFFDFFRRILMLMFDMVNNFIRLFSGGILSLK